MDLTEHLWILHQVWVVLLRGMFTDQQETKECLESCLEANSCSAKAQLQKKPCYKSINAVFISKVLQEPEFAHYEVAKYSHLNQGSTEWLYFRHPRMAPKQNTTKKHWKKSTGNQFCYRLRSWWQTYFRLGWLLATFTAGLNHLLN